MLFNDHQCNLKAHLIQQLIFYFSVNVGNDIHEKELLCGCNLFGGLGLPGTGKTYYYPYLAGLWPPSPYKLQQKYSKKKNIF